MTDRDYPPVSAIMCTWNEARMAPLAVESIAAFVDELVVVDAGSDDGTLDAIRYGASGFDVDIRAWVEPDLKLREARLFAVERATHDWLLVCDGDEVFHTDGPNAIQDVLPPLMDRESVVYRFPMRYLYADLEHTHLNRVELPPHKTLYHDDGSIAPMPEARDLPDHGGGGYAIDTVVKFNCGVKDWRRQFLRERFWYDWSKEADSDLPIEEYAQRELGVDDLGDHVEGFRERRLASENVVPYDAERWGYVPKVIREWVERGDVRGYEG